MGLIDKALQKYAMSDLEVSDEELRKCLDEHWTEVSSDPKQLETARRRVTEAKQVEAGIVPAAFTDTTDCKYCGPVFIYPGYPNPANNCPWCFNRIKGLPIPRGIDK